jgi:hypothetical protein
MLRVFSILVLSLFTIPAFSLEWSSGDLIQYYSKLPGQYLIPEDIAQFRNQSFQVGQDQTIKPLGSLQFNDEFTQDLFKLDPKAYVESWKGQDFLEAKENFYKRLTFNPKSQRHEKPYSYLSGWLSLNHPPLKKITESTAPLLSIFSNQNPAPEVSAYFDPSFQADLDRFSGTELSFGNELKPLFNGDSFSAKVKLVESAKKYVLASVMAISCDQSSMPLVNALINRAQSGIPVKMIMEGFYGNFIFRACARKLRRGGVEVVMAHDSIKRRTPLTFFHAKFWIRDGEEAIVGGQNIIKYQNQSTGFNEFNRDTDLSVRGPAATDFTREYIDLWQDTGGNPEKLPLKKDEIINKQNMETQRLERGLPSYPEKLGSPLTREKGVCRVLVQNAYHQNRSLAAVIERYIDAAQQSVVISSPEVEFPLKAGKTNALGRFYKSIIQAAKRKLDVEFISNGVDGGNGELTSAYRLGMQRAYRRGNHLLYAIFHTILEHEPEHNARDHRQYLLRLRKEAGIRTWTHFNYIHAKQIFIDRILTSISSMNLDQASIQRNYEAGIVCMDHSLSQAMESQLTLDLVNSVPVISSNGL